MSQIVFNPFTIDFDFVGGSGGGSPVGPDGAVQFNDSGSFGGIAGAIYDSGTNRLAFSTEINGIGILATYNVAGVYTPGSYGQYASEIWLDGTNPPFNNAFRVKDISGGGAGVDTYFIDRLGNVTSLGVSNLTSIVGYGPLGAVQYNGLSNGYMAGDSGFTYDGAGTITIANVMATNLFGDGSGITSVGVFRISGSGDNIWSIDSVPITSGQYNFFVGLQAGGNAMNTGSDNQFIGFNTGYFNTSGFSNTFIGTAAGNANQDGANNIYIGNSAGHLNVSGSQNVFVGTSTGANSLGTGNTFIGYATGIPTTTASNCIIIGQQLNLPSVTDDNQLNIGNIIYGTAIDGSGGTISSGNIGIGIKAPAYKLDVDGTVNATAFLGDGSALTGIVANLTIGNTVSGGTVNEVLYVDSSGNLANSSSFTYDGAGNVTATSFIGSGASLTGINQAQVNTGSGITPVADGTYQISATLGGSVTFASGLVTAWNPAA